MPKACFCCHLPVTHMLAVMPAQVWQCLAKACPWSMPIVLHPRNEKCRHMCMCGVSAGLTSAPLACLAVQCPLDRFHSSQPPVAPFQRQLGMPPLLRRPSAPSLPQHRTLLCVQQAVPLALQRQCITSGPKVLPKVTGFPREYLTPGQFRYSRPLAGIVCVEEEAHIIT